ncbi:hypothetical protein C5612_04325 [Pseudomonas frederiksbergensis]|uniref:Uncharacterized protein n=1 Tax=Pseudomonas frederiksbergensis TaxID=104087 RepID=A0A2S8HTH7_9PSED|nr:hypothetical protein C5612_04325 [Pseudomonas frederiksbergensis]
MVEYPGMWVETRSLFKVGTVAAVMRMLSLIWPEPAPCGVSTWCGGAWVSGSIIGRSLTIEQGHRY